MTNTLIRASAGAGKTFQLSNQYLDLLFRDESVDSILASTFTRKAAGEITDRILQRFAAAALDQAEREKLREHVVLPTSLLPPRIKTVSYQEPSYREDENEPATMAPSAASDQRQVAALQQRLAELACNLYRLRISTLDSFFNKMATSFSLELGLPPGWSIMDDSSYAAFLADAIQQVLRESPRQETRRLMNLLEHGEPGQRVTKKILDLAENLLPLVRVTHFEAWQNEILLRKQLSETERHEWLDRLERAPVPRNKDNTEKKSYIKAKNTFINKIHARDESLLIDKWAQAILSADQGGDTRFDKVVIPTELFLASKPLVEDALEIYFDKLVWQTRATYQLLEPVLHAYEEIIAQKRLFRFEDIAHRLSTVASKLDLSRLFHRMDSVTKHLLLDEFQDTSQIQWDVMKPFAFKAATEPDGSFFCVGDVKQAIYGWRGGSAEIFQTDHAQIPDIKVDGLNTTYRCSPVVIEAVNTIFTCENIQHNAALEKYPEAAKIWGQRFEPHLAKKTDLPGHVILESVFVPKDAEQDSDKSHNAETDSDDNEENSVSHRDPMIQYTVQRIKELHENHPGRSIGVLVAKNKTIAPIMAGLKECHIEASGEGGNPLTDSAAVQQMFSLLVLADHPGDTVARFHLASGPLCETLGLEIYRNGNCFDNRSDRGPALTASFRIRRSLLDRGFAATLNDYAEILMPACHAREFQRLSQLIELAREYEKTASGVRTQPFLQRVATQKIESSTAANIRIMTIHKSKGLEFDIVVLPDLDNKLEKHAPMVLIGTDSKTTSPAFVIRYPKKAMQSFFPAMYQNAFKRHTQAAVEESLSLLYVAMTRAIHSLVMIVKSKEQSESTLAGVLRAGFAAESCKAAPTLHESGCEIAVHYERGVSNWFESLETGKSHRKIVPIVPQKLNCLLKKQTGQRNSPRKSPSRLETSLPVLKQNGLKPDFVFDAEKMSENAAAKRSRAAAQLRGIAIHACFEQAFGKKHSCEKYWIEAGLPLAEELLKIVKRSLQGKHSDIEPPRIVEDFFAICEQSAIRAALSEKSVERNGHETVEVEHERRFAVRDGEFILHGSVDRLVVVRERDKVVRAEIIDFKTDTPREGEHAENFLAERREIYREQMEAYRTAMSLLFEVDKMQVKCKLLFLSLNAAFEF